jgi:hypothetical protein
MAYEGIGYTPGSGKDVAADNIAARLFQRIKIAFGVEGAAVDVSETNPLPVAGPVTDAQLRAAPLPVSGGLTDAELRASPIPVSASIDVSALETPLRQLVLAAISPTGFDRSLNRGRVTALLESGTVTTVTTVAGLTNIDGRNGAMLINQTNLSAWADCVRARIT